MSLALKHEFVTMRVNDRDGESLTFKFGLVVLEQALAHLECYAPQQIVRTVTEWDQRRALGPCPT